MFTHTSLPTLIVGGGAVHAFWEGGDCARNTFVRRETRFKNVWRRKIRHNTFGRREIPQSWEESVSAFPSLTIATHFYMDFHNAKFSSYTMCKIHQLISSKYQESTTTLPLYFIVIKLCYYFYHYQKWSSLLFGHHHPLPTLANTVCSPMMGIWEGFLTVVLVGILTANVFSVSILLVCPPKWSTLTTISNWLSYWFSLYLLYTDFIFLFSVIKSLSDEPVPPELSKVEYISKHTKHKSEENIFIDCSFSF